MNTIIVNALRDIWTTHEVTHCILFPKVNDVCTVLDLENDRIYAIDGHVSIPVSKVYGIRIDTFSFRLETTDGDFYHFDLDINKR